MLLPFLDSELQDFPSPVEVTEALMGDVKMNHYGYPYIDSDFEKLPGGTKVRHNTVLNPEYIDFSTYCNTGYDMVYRKNSQVLVIKYFLQQTPVYPPFTRGISEEFANHSVTLSKSC